MSSDLEHLFRLYSFQTNFSTRPVVVVDFVVAAADVVDVLLYIQILLLKCVF